MSLGASSYYWCGDKSLTAVYADHVLLPKRVTDAFYVKMMRCYEELFEASLNTKMSLAMKACADNTAKQHLLADPFAKLNMSDVSAGSHGVIGTYTPRSHSFSVRQDASPTLEKSHVDGGKFRGTAKSFSAKPARHLTSNPHLPASPLAQKSAAVSQGTVYHFKSNDMAGTSYDITMYKTKEITSL